MSRLKMTMLLMAQHRYEEAAEHFRDELARIEASERTGDGLWAHAGLLACAAAASDWPTWDRSLRHVRERILDSGVVDDDVASLAHLAAELARRSGEKKRSRRAYELARTQYERMGRPEVTRSIDTALLTLGS